MDKVFIYVTVSNEDEARRIGRALVEEKRVACVNVLGRVSSMYWWEGKVEEDTEVVMIAKTTADAVDAVTQRVVELHSYDVPCVVALPISAGHPEFLKWITESVTATKPVR